MSHWQESVAPAKINLALHVTGRRDDGYHLLDTLVVFTRLGDRLRVEAASEDSFEVTGPFGRQVPSDAANLILRARDLMREHFGAAAERPVKILLAKNLPVAAGIGGGSSDAAGALTLLSRYWNIEAEPDALAGIALRLGADVPMCLAARPLSARGIGDRIDVIPLFPELPLLLVNPGIPLATPEVFKALLNRENPPLPTLRGMSTDDVVDWLAATRNDLEPPALALLPAIGGVLSALRDEGALVARMSGSGATCFGVFKSAQAAAEAEFAISSEYPGWFVKATSTMPAAEEAFSD